MLSNSGDHPRVAVTAEFKIISWNLLHAMGAAVEDVQALIARYRPDLFLMQEATARIDHLPERVGGHYARVVLPGRLHGLAAWSPLAWHKPARFLPLQDGLVVRRVCQVLDLGPFTVANVHLSHGQMLNRRQLRRIATVLPERAAILGDCNMLGAPFLPGFRDVGPRQMTHRMQGMVPLRLDRCFIRGLRYLSGEILDRGASDHRPLMVLLAGG
jgi:endonuclease/exonuclease/phosphatase (EEP) superfamily protein YafD